VSPPTRRTPAEGRPGSKTVSQANDRNSVRASIDEDHDQQALWDVPRARNHIRTDGTLIADPPTSSAAAESVSLESVTRLQRAILNTLMVARAPLRDEEICDRLKWMHTAESGIRSRRSELLRAGLIEVADSKGLTSHQRPCRRYRVRAEKGVA
jgi:hypothetical protein